MGCELRNCRESAPLVSSKHAAERRASNALSHFWLELRESRSRWRQSFGSHQNDDFWWAPTGNKEEQLPPPPTLLYRCQREQLTLDAIINCFLANWHLPVQATARAPFLLMFARSGGRSSKLAFGRWGKPPGAPKRKGQVALAESDRGE